MSKSKSPGQLNILELLPAHRRQEIIAEALRGQVVELYRSNPDMTLGDFVDTLTQNEYWDSMKEMRMSPIFVPRDLARSAAGHQAGPRKRAGRLTGDVIERVFSYIQRNPNQRSEQIRAALRNEDPNDVQRAIVWLRREGRVTSQGERRAMTYSPA